MEMRRGYHFIDGFGAFALEEPQQTSYLYFPLVNETGLVSSVTPSLHGDIKAGQHAYLTPPVSVEDLHNSRWARNFWVKVKGGQPWSATGNSAAQIAASQTEQADRVTLEAGFLWQRIRRSNPVYSLQVEILNFVPSRDDRVELMQVTLENTGSE
ncbi:MAG: cellobiose phosphorylase, partial [Omnitrophica WOR_2 bacterium]